MAGHGIAPTPRNYEIWFAYADGNNPGLGRASEAELETNAEITEEISAEIYNNYLSNEDSASAVQGANKMLREEMARIMRRLSESGGDTSRYKDSLGDYSARLAAKPNVAELGQVITGLVNETESMAEQSNLLEQELEASANKIADLESSLAAVQEQALTDPLTGIANRKSFDEGILEAITESQQECTPVTLAMADIDHFKKFNDTWGHQVGDEVIRLVAKVLTNNTKGRDLTARYGGEEFALVLPMTRINQAEVVTNQLREAVARSRITRKNSGEVLGQITLSFGVAQHIPGESVEALIARADEALYAARNAGRNQVACDATRPLEAGGQQV